MRDKHAHHCTISHENVRISDSASTPFCLNRSRKSVSHMTHMRRGVVQRTEQFSVAKRDSLVYILKCVGSYNKLFVSRELPLCRSREKTNMPPKKEVKHSKYILVDMLA